MSMYYAKTARRQPVQLWQCVAMRLTLTGDDNESLRLVEAWVEKMHARFSSLASYAKANPKRAKPRQSGGAGSRGAAGRRRC